MSTQIPGLAPATRVVSRKLGPTSGSRSESSPSVAAASPASTLAITRRWLTVAITRSCVWASIASGRAPSSAIARCRRSYRSPLERCVGTRHQRDALEQVRPRVLDPRGFRPGERVLADEALSVCGVGKPRDQAALGRPDVGDDGVLVACLEASATSAGSAPTGAAQKTISAPRTVGDRIEPRRALRARAPAPASRVGVEPGDLCAEAPPRREPDRATDQPHTQNRDLHTATDSAALAREPRLASPLALLPAGGGRRGH